MDKRRGGIINNQADPDPTKPELYRGTTKRSKSTRFTSLDGSFRLVAGARQQSGCGAIIITLPSYLIRAEYEKPGTRDRINSKVIIDPETK